MSVPIVWTESCKSMGFNLCKAVLSSIFSHLGKTGFTFKKFQFSYDLNDYWQLCQKVFLYLIDYCSGYTLEAEQKRQTKVHVRVPSGLNFFVFLVGMQVY